MHHGPVFVLTHHARAPLAMESGTTFYFVTEGPAVALELIDEMHLAIAPVLLGAGERLFEGVNLPALGYTGSKSAASSLATHVVLSRSIR